MVGDHQVLTQLTVTWGRDQGAETPLASPPDHPGLSCSACRHSHTENVESAVVELHHEGTSRAVLSDKGDVLFVQVMFAQPSTTTTLTVRAQPWLWPGAPWRLLPSPAGAWLLRCVTAGGVAPEGRGLTAPHQHWHYYPLHCGEQ